LLADNHPHLLAMPFVLLAVAFSLQIFFRSRPITIQKRFDEISDRAKNTLLALAGLGLLMVIPTSLSSALQETTLPSSLLFSLLSDLVLYGLAFGAVSFVVLLLLGYGQIPLTRQELLVGGLIFGSLAYLNTWDFPIYLSLFFGVLLLKASRTSTLTALRQSITGTLGLLILGVGFYLPWYPTFASQAGGILPHVLHPTRFLHFFIMFGTALVPIAVWLGMIFSQESEGRDWIRLIAYGIGLPILLMVLMLLLALMVYTFVDPMILERAFSMMPASSFGEAVNMIITTRIMTSWTAWVLGLIFGAGFLVLRSSWIKSGETNPDQFVIILVLIGALLVIGPEFFYLRDQFGLRMNTIFKFYFAAWILWGLAAAYAVNAIGQRRPKRFLGLQILVIIPLLFGLIYPVIGTWTKTDGFNPPFGRTLNGSMYPSYAPEADRTAVMWIDENLEDGVIAEAVGGSYTYYARISAHTGLPTVIGWPGHESQWRGGYVEIGNRESDIRTVYTSPDWDQTEKILQQYAIDYVYIGPLERSSYRPLVEQKFMAYMDLIYQNEEVRIYATRERSAP
jgi:YYY domain-containing protein